MIFLTASLNDLKMEFKENIYCFGSGRAFDHFMKEFSYLNLEENMKAIVDNNAHMSDGVKELHDKSIPIISVDQMLRNIQKSDCIVITTSAYKEIIRQLEKIEILKYVRCFIYWMVRIEQLDYERLNIDLPSRMSKYENVHIPKKLHYCWFGEKPIPDRCKMWMASWKKYCPDYEMVEWNESNYNVHKCKYISQAYALKKWAFVSDYARLDIIQEHGGVYLDTDVELLRSIDILLKNDAFCGFEKSKYVNFGLGFGAPKGNSIIGEIKEYYENKSFLLEDGIIDNTACPIIQTEIMRRHGLMCKGEFQIMDGMTVYPERVLCGMSPYSFRVEKAPLHTYMIHHFGGSWIEDEDRVKKKKLISEMTEWSKSSVYIYLPGTEKEEL